MDTNKISRVSIKLFILANIGLLVIAAVFYLYPTGASWLYARGSVTRMERVYAAYSFQAAQYYGLDTLHPVHQILPYAGLTAALDGVQDMAAAYGLTTRQFTAAGPVSYTTLGGSFVEVRVQALFMGFIDNIEEFTYGLAESAAQVRSLRMNFLGDGAVELHLEFSLFGREE